eukprot:6463891-Amphidinium_carterae.2
MVLVAAVEEGDVCVSEVEELEVSLSTPQNQRQRRNPKPKFKRQSLPRHKDSSVSGCAMVIPPPKAL